MFQKAVAAVLVCAMVAPWGAGCGRPSRHSHGSGKVLVEHPPRRKPEFGWTRVPAVYVLFGDRKPASGFPGATRGWRHGWALTSLPLEKREPLGFRTVNGQLYAVAGGDQIPLPEGEYCWHTKPGTEPIDWGATAICVALIAGAVVGGYALAWAASWGGISIGPQ